MGPSELTLLGLNREAFKRSDSKSYKGPCFRCGGTDRFRVFTWRPWPQWYAFCNQCGWKGWADELVPELRHSFSKELRLEWDRIRREAEAEDAAQLRQRRIAFAKGKKWVHYHGALKESHRQTLRQWGIDDAWQEYLQIGYVRQKQYWHDKLCVAPAISFPYFGENWTPLTIQYRLMGEGIEDRYRFEKGLGTSYYNPTPDDPIGQSVLIVEGVKKAIVTCILGHLNVKVLAVPSRSDFGGIEGVLAKCACKWVLLDPDATERAKILASRIDGKVLELPFKIDDYLLDYKFAWKELRSMVV